MSFKRALVCLMCLTSVVIAEPEACYEKDPYSDIEVLPFDAHGWYENAQQIEQIFRQRKIRTVVEVGCWLGSSTRHIATLLPQGGKLYAVDHWLGSVEHQQDTTHLSCLYQQFLSNVIHARLTDKIIPVKMPSLEAADCLAGLKVDAVYIDASHDTQSVLQDLRAWYPFIKNHGVLCGDDWGWDSVRQAVIIFARESGLRIYHAGNFWQCF